MSIKRILLPSSILKHFHTISQFTRYYNYYIILITNRNWTSIELAKPDWEEEELARRDLEEVNVGSGSVQQLNVNEVDTYGFWDQSLDILPAMSR